jgi:hypothetical protein
VAECSLLSAASSLPSAPSSPPIPAGRPPRLVFERSGEDDGDGTAGVVADGDGTAGVVADGDGDTDALADGDAEVLAAGATAGPEVSTLASAGPPKARLAAEPTTAVPTPVLQTMRPRRALPTSREVSSGAFKAKSSPTEFARSLNCIDTSITSCFPSK